MGDNTSWLVTTPPGDINFISHLKTATDEEIREAIKKVEERGRGVKTKITVLKRELYKRENRRAYDAAD